MKFFILQAFILFVTVITISLAACPPGCQSCEGGRLQCPGAGLTSLPTPMPEDTFTVDLTQNDIESLDALPNLPEVQSFRISINRLRMIKGGDFDNVPSLVSLDLSMNSISKVYKHGLRGLTNLKTISLTGNQITEIGQIFRNTPALTSIRLGNNEIESIEEENFEKNTMIKMLDLSHNRISSIHGDAFKNMDMLRYLILSNNPISVLSDLSFSSTMLSLADFSNCKLESVPRTMPPSLTDYRLGNNRITSINDDDFKNITRLRLLTLNDNKISLIEHRSIENENLKELWLSRNDMVYIPRGLPTGLIKLFMDNNQVVELEPMLFKEDSQLKVLSLHNNKVRKVHQDSLKYTKELEKVNLQGNEISLIDVGTFTNLTNLQMLTLTNNPIQVIEEGAFSGLDSLTDLAMAYVEPPRADSGKMLHENFLTAMPSVTSIDLMSSIKLTKAFLDILAETDSNTFDSVMKVNLQYNELTTLPEAVQTVFPNIKQLLLDGNILQCDPNLLWLRAWMQTSTSVSFHQYEQVACDAPAAVKGRLISELSPHDFTEIPDPPPQESNTQPPEPAVPQRGSSVQSSNNNRQPAEAQSYETDRQPAEEPETRSKVNTDPARHSSVAGVRVVIKPPKDQSAETASERQPAKQKKQTKAEKKAARKAARERKQKEKEERKRRRKAMNKKKGTDGKRKKRRIRNKKNKKCTVDKDGKKTCVRGKRCKVDQDGNVKCRKRKDKKDKKSNTNAA